MLRYSPLLLVLCYAVTGPAGSPIDLDHGSQESSERTGHARMAGTLPLGDALAAVIGQRDAKVVMEVSPDQEHVSLPKGPRTLDQSLNEIAAQVGARSMDRKGIVVLQPETYPDASEFEAVYRRAMEALGDFLEHLKATDREAILAEEWLDFKALSAAEQKRIRKAVFDAPWDERTWKIWLNHDKIAVGFLFDPYIEIDRPKVESGTRIFIRTRYVLPAYDRLVPGRSPGTLRPGFDRRERP